MTIRFNIEDIFPETEPGERPVGNYVLVQMFKVAEKTSGGILLPDEVRDLEQGSVIYAKVVALGSNAFRMRATGETWGAGNWYDVGDILRIPRNRAGEMFRSPVDPTVTFFYIQDEAAFGVVDPRVITGGFVEADKE